MADANGLVGGLSTRHFSSFTMPRRFPLESSGRGATYGATHGRGVLPPPSSLHQPVPPASPNCHQSQACIIMQLPLLHCKLHRASPTHHMPIHFSQAGPATDSTLKDPWLDATTSPKLPEVNGCSFIFVTRGFGGLDTPIEARSALCLKAQMKLFRRPIGGAQEGPGGVCSSPTRLMHTHPPTDITA